MTPQLFQTLASQGYNRIPLVREVCADLDTPLSVYLKLAGSAPGATAPYSYLFESVQGGEKWGRYSIIGLPCRTLVRVAGADMHRAAINILAVAWIGVQNAADARL